MTSPATFYWDRARCHVCNAEAADSCQAIDGEIAECPRPSRAAPCEHDYRHAETGPTWELVRCSKCGDERRNFND